MANIVASFFSYHSLQLVLHTQRILFRHFSLDSTYPLGWQWIENVLWKYYSNLLSPFLRSSTYYDDDYVFQFSRLVVCLTMQWRNYSKIQLSWRHMKRREWDKNRPLFRCSRCWCWMLLLHRAHVHFVCLCAIRTKTSWNKIYVNKQSVFIWISRRHTPGESHTNTIK